MSVSVQGLVHVCVPFLSVFPVFSGVSVAVSVCDTFLLCWWSFLCFGGVSLCVRIPKHVKVAPV